MSYLISIPLVILILIFSVDAIDYDGDSLTDLLNELKTNASTNDGFWNASRANLYGLGSCRGDTSNLDCSQCLASAADTIVKKRQDAFWSDDCFMKVSSSAFFGIIDMNHTFPRENKGHVSRHIDEFKNATVNLLSSLAKAAADDRKMFAHSHVNEQVQNLTIHGMAQCNRDLSKSTCKQCLDDVIDDLSTCCGDSIGVTYACGSCQVRYEPYAFITS